MHDCLFGFSLNQLFRVGLYHITSNKYPMIKALLTVSKLLKIKSGLQATKIC